jgi:hypothetical protein
MRTKTFTLVKTVLYQDVIRCYGRGLLRTYLRIKYHHNVREDDVRDVLAMLDVLGTESRRKSVDKTRNKDGEYFIPGPD